MAEPIHIVTSAPAFPAQADVLLKTTKALPAANAANVHDSIDLESLSLYPTNKDVWLEVDLPATPSLANGIAATLTIKDSADNVTFTAIPELATVVATGGGGAGAAAINRKFPLPGTTRRYLRLEQAVANTGGDNTAVVVTAQLRVRL